MIKSNIKQIQKTIYKVHLKLVSMQEKLYQIKNKNDVECMVGKLIRIDDDFTFCLNILLKEINICKNKNNNENLIKLFNLDLNIKKLINFSHILIFAMDNNFGKLAYNEIDDFINYMLDICEEIY